MLLGQESIVADVGDLDSDSKNGQFDNAAMIVDAFEMPPWKHLRAVLLLPGVVTVLIPTIIICRTGTDTFDLLIYSLAIRILVGVLDVFSIACGLALMIATNRLFAKIGQGTLAPWNPRQKLVVEGVYRYVRNPMISGVFFILMGESLATASRPLFYWFLIFVAINMTFIPLFEEPDLHRRFGADYDEYRRHVPRWIPRLKPWNSNDNQPERGTS